LCHYFQLFESVKSKLDLKLDQDIAGFETLQSISSAPDFNYWMYKTIFPYLKGRVLELGSGIGNISDYIIKDFNDVTLSDYNSDYCLLLKNKYHSHTSVKQINSLDLQDPQFKIKNAHLKESFDSIVLLNVIEHLQDDQLSVDYCHFLLKNDGHLILLAPAYQLLYSNLDREIGHYRRYTSLSLTRLIQSDFKILRQQYFNFLGMTAWLIVNKILGRKKLSRNSMATFNKLVPVAKLLDKIIAFKAGVSIIVVGQKK
jgi:2-polyprenyl-3-methyl-5-hydroxy-6-metoxy-1,4-benzoquinol methylase